MAESEPLLIEVTPEGVATVTLNRPQVHNALNGELIEALADLFDDLGKQDGVRAVILQGHGQSFCAGGDLAWMRRSADLTYDENVEGTLALAQMLRSLNEMPKPTLALIHGNAFAGGIGLIAACDIAVATEDTVFSLSEVKLGLIAATISPYVIAAIGQRQARRYFLTAERFGAREAQRIGLVHDVVADQAALATARNTFLHDLLLGGPEAIARSKALIGEVVGRPVTAELMLHTAKVIADARADREGQEGLTAFLEKRKPGWVPPEG